MQETAERRGDPRLKLTYPIETQVREPGQVGKTRSVTSNVGARGAYFKTFDWDHFQVGQQVSIRIEVPHPLQTGDQRMQLDMRVAARVLRMDRIRGIEALGEDGLELKGVAVAFDAPLELRYFWT